VRARRARAGDSASHGTSVNVAVAITPASAPIDARRGGATLLGHGEPEPGAIVPERRVRIDELAAASAARRDRRHAAIGTEHEADRVAARAIQPDAELRPAPRGRSLGRARARDRSGPRRVVRQRAALGRIGVGARSRTRT
jgi:hypothetical protein